MNSTKLIEIFCAVDDFCKIFDRYLRRRTLHAPARPLMPSVFMSLSEVMTICIYYHQSGYKNFKAYYRSLSKKDFPTLLSYSRFIELKRFAVFPLFFFHQRLAAGKCTGISFCDSTKLAVCHNKRILSHKTFKSLANRGKTSVGWFFGFKLHLAISHQGEVIGISVTPGNVDDRDPMVIKHLTHQIQGLLFADKGYMSQKLFEQLLDNGIKLITKIRSNMKNKLMESHEKMLLKKRAVIESVFDLLKEHCNIEHSRHRSPINFFENIFSALSAYAFYDKKPAIFLSKNEIELF